MPTSYRCECSYVRPLVQQHALPDHTLAYAQSSPRSMHLRSFRATSASQPRCPYLIRLHDNKELISISLVCGRFRYVKVADTIVRGGTVQQTVLTDFAIWTAKNETPSSSMPTQLDHVKQTPSRLCQHPCSSPDPLPMSPRTRLLISTCCLGPDTVPRQCRQPGVRTSLRVPRNQRS